jgi:undecaprenyl-diphosphatase
MELTQALLLALIQGITEFLPISSTAHLILVPLFTDWPDQGLAYDVALNTATWLAVVIYFRRDILDICKGFFRSLFERKLEGNHNGALAWMTLAATIPVGLGGVLAHDLVAGPLRSLEIIGWSSIVWGLVLWAADMRPGKKEIESVGWKEALFVGLAQAVALIPGTSRSGITMTAGLFAGLSRTAAARFSFLLAIIVGALAGGKEGLDMVMAGERTPWAAVFVGGAVAFVSAYLAIHYFLKLISRSSMASFVVYRVILGAVLLAFAYKLF